MRRMKRRLSQNFAGDLFQHLDRRGLRFAHLSDIEMESLLQGEFAFQGGVQHLVGIDQPATAGREIQRGVRGGLLINVEADRNIHLDRVGRGQIDRGGASRQNHPCQRQAANSKNGMDLMKIHNKPARPAQKYKRSRIFY